MFDKNYQFLDVFSSLSHPNFDLTLFRQIFIKAAWKAYTDIELSPISQTNFQTIFLPLYDSLFLENDKDMEVHITNMRTLLIEQEKVDRFLSDTFYIILNYYIKSFYGLNSGWSKIVPFTRAIENFIDYVSKRFNNESFFIFEDALINALELLRQRSEKITVLNTYYGVPIQYTAQIIHTDPQHIIIKAHPLQETAAILQNGIYLLKNSEFKHDVYASITPIMHDGERLLELSRFDRLENSLFHRQSIRVQPHSPHPFHIIQNSITMNTNIYDISIGGVAVTSQHSYSLMPMSRVIMMFPSEILELQDIQGEFVFKSSYEGGYKYHFKISLSLQQEGELSKYISRREQEIIKKLRDEIV